MRLHLIGDVLGMTAIFAIGLLGYILIGG